MLALLSIVSFVLVIVIFLGLFVNKKIIIWSSRIFFVTGLISGVYYVYQFYVDSYTDYCNDPDGYCLNELGSFILIPLMLLAFGSLSFLISCLISKKK